MTSFVSLPLALALLTGAGEIDVATVDDVADIGGAWRFHEGDGAFDAPSFDDSAWPAVHVPQGLGEQGYAALVGVYWLRVRLRLAPAVTDSGRELSIRLGPVDSACQVFIDGRLVGGKGRVDPPEEDAHDNPSVWAVPLDASGDGDVVIAIRAWRNPLREDSAPSRGGITGGPLWIGKTDDIVRAQDGRDIDNVLAGFTVLVVGVYHLQLFRRRREQLHYLWFGVFSLFMGTHLLASTDASIALLGTMWHARLFWMSLILALPTFLQFWWPLIGRPIRWWWRVNQAAMVAYTVIAVTWPTQWFVIKFMGWFELLLLMPLMVATVVVVIGSAWRGNPEARTVLLGTLGLVVASAGNILMERTTLQMPQLMSYAMALLVFSMAVSLANRFSRVFRELDEKNTALMRMDRLVDEVRRLNQQVQAKVKDRSEELSKALTQLVHKEGAGAISGGTVLDGRYVVERLLGAGGMGAVYAGRDLVTNAAVAIKVMKASSATEVDALHRFLREARAVVAVDHPAIVRMLHVDISGDGMFYQVQELVDGVTLEDRLKSGPLEPASAARAASILAEALAAAHAAGVIHRDVKPANIMLTRAVPGLKLLDFGVAKITTAPSEHTGTGRLIGTPAYMAPEQRYLTDNDVTERVDVYALGLVVHRMVTGGFPGRVLDPKAPREILDLVDECLREDPGARPRAAALATRLGVIADALGAPLPLTWGEEATQDGGITDLMRELVRAP